MVVVVEIEGGFRFINPITGEILVEGADKDELWQELLNSGKMPRCSGLDVLAE